MHICTYSGKTVKGTITVVSCASIAYFATHAQNWYGTSCAYLIGIVSIIIGTYQMPPLCATAPSS